MILAVNYQPQVMLAALESMEKKVRRLHEAIKPLLTRVSDGHHF